MVDYSHMENFKQEIKTILGSSYQEALAAYNNSNAATADKLQFSFGLPKAAYDFLELARKTFTSPEASDQVKLELTQVIYGLLILHESRERLSDEQANDIIKAMNKVCKSSAFFTENDDSMAMQRALNQLCTFFQAKVDSDTSTKP